VQKLLLEIARCPVLESVLDDPAERPAHPCAAVALTQWEWAGLPPEDRRKRWRAAHQVPEPWVGHLREAPLLFVSSNPSISGAISENPDDPAPGLTWNDSDETLVERYEDGFDKFIVDGIRHRGGTKPVRFWVEVRSRARELMGGRSPKPGHDYVLTEVVHCKSWDEEGVAEALGTCSGLYLKRTILASGARVVIFLGRWAERAAWETLGVPTSVGIKCEQHVLRYRLGKRERLVGFPPHPNHRGERTPRACWHPEELEDVRGELAT
jgi:hypothetical protein